MRFSRLSSTWRIFARLPSLRTGAGMRAFLLGGRRAQRQREVECRALTFPAFRPDAAPVELDEFLADGEPEPRAVRLLGERIVEALKGLEQACEIGGRDPDAGIGH